MNTGLIYDDSIETLTHSTGRVTANIPNT